jgi:hypothetical protein
LRDIQRQVTGSIEEMQSILHTSGQRFQEIEQSAAEIDRRTGDIRQSTRVLNERNQGLLKIGQENEASVRELREGIDGMHQSG